MLTLAVQQVAANRTVPIKQAIDEPLIPDSRGSFSIFIFSFILKNKYQM